MKCIYSKNSEQLQEDLVREICLRLKKDLPVLFIVSGGSTAKIAVSVCQKILSQFPRDPSKLQSLLTVTLADERWGVEGHSDSNWRLLIEQGLPVNKIGSMPIIPPFKKTSQSDEQERKDATKIFNVALDSAVHHHSQGNLYIVGLFGIGEDGHTAGLLPKSPALEAQYLHSKTGPWACHYSSVLFKRITITPAFFSHIDLALAWAAGPSKRVALAAACTAGPEATVPARYMNRAARSEIHTDQDMTGES